LFFAWSLAELWRIGSFESQTVDWIIVSLGVFFITAAATQYAAAKFRSNMEKIGAVSNLRLTAGDEKSVVRVAAKNRLWFKKGNRGSLWRRSSDRAKSRQCSNL
jgi:hypothetical protein